MPATWLVAQRVRYPNGTLSDPFVVSMSRGDMLRFATIVATGAWGRREEPDDFRSDSYRMACAHGGAFWQTARTWYQHVCDSDRQIGPVLLVRRPGIELLPGDHPDRRLFMGEVGLLFCQSDEWGWQALHALGIADPLKALARTVLEWCKQIEACLSGYHPLRPPVVPG